MAKKPKKPESKFDDSNVEGLNKHMDALNLNFESHRKVNEKLLEKRNKMAAEATGLTIKQAHDRQEYQREKSRLDDEIKKAVEEGGENAPKAAANRRIIEKMDKKQRMKESLRMFTSLEGLKGGINSLADNVGGKVKATGSMLLKGIGIIALFAFLQSDTFKSIVKSIVNFVTDFVGLFTGEIGLIDFIKDNFGMFMITLALIGAKLYAIGTSKLYIATMTKLSAAFNFLFGPKGFLMKNMIPRLKLMAKSSYTKVVDMLGPAFNSLFGKAGFLRATIIPKLKLMGAGLLAKGKVMMLGLATGFKGMLVGLGAILAPMLPVIAVVGAIAAAAYGVVRIFQGFQEYFGEANEQFGFFGGILAGFTGGIKNILGDVAGVLDAIFGFFGFPDLMDPIIKAIEDFDVMDFVGGIMNFFSGLGDFLMDSLAGIGRLFKAIGLGAAAALGAAMPGGESPTEAFMRVFDETLAGGSASAGKTDLDNVAASGAQMSGGEDDPARFIARKENEDMQMRRKEEMMGDKRAVMITNNNVINKGGDNYSEVRGGDVNVHDTAQSPYYNPT
tara:strand:+ start:121 stop:1794 length:1674 start_codon:yes stop_codon:yes gene_type:complete